MRELERIKGRTSGRKGVIRLLRSGILPKSSEDRNPIIDILEWAVWDAESLMAEISRLRQIVGEEPANTASVVYGWLSRHDGHTFTLYGIEGNLVLNCNCEQTGKQEKQG